MKWLIPFIGILFSSIFSMACERRESSFSGQVLRVINLPQVQKCLLQIDFNQIDSKSECSIKLEAIEKQYIQVKGGHCNYKMDQSITGVVTNTGHQFFLNNKS